MNFLGFYGTFKTYFKRTFCNKIIVFSRKLLPNLIHQIGPSYCSWFATLVWKGKRPPVEPYAFDSPYTTVTAANSAAVQQVRQGDCVKAGSLKNLVEAYLFRFECSLTYVSCVVLQLKHFYILHKRARLERL
jgi:hypothetical protein